MLPSSLTSLISLSLFLAPFTAVWADAAPTVQLDQATVYGATNGSVTSYFNIPFAEPPVGDLRLRLPKPIANYSGTINATQAGPQCVQQMLPLRSDTPDEMVRDVLAALSRGVSPDDPSPESEDCLNLNVLVPAGTTPGEVMVERSIDIGQPIIFAAINYRLNAFGFLGGQEVKDAGVRNIGLYDEREGLMWINKHISAFGGDPNQVTIWGPSAGGFSVGTQMVTNGGDSEGLFRAAVLSCGSLLPTGDITSQQPSFDSMVEQVGCAAAEDKLQCLRGVPVDNFTAAATSVTGFFGEGAVPPWFPRVDGKFLVEPVRDAVLAGRIADVPFIAGDSLDEGTIFATGAWNITTDDEFLDYARDFFFPGASNEEVAPLLALYPNDPAQGSPFGTGDADQLAPMYKRVAAFEGDFLFQSTRRSLLTLRAGKQPAWTYMVERGGYPGIGYPHGNDVVSLGQDEAFMDRFIRFVATLDPNVGAPGSGSGSNGMSTTLFWPRYDPVERQMLLVRDGEEVLAIGRDDARAETMEVVGGVEFEVPRLRPIATMCCDHQYYSVRPTPPEAITDHVPRQRLLSTLGPSLVDSEIRLDMMDYLVHHGHQEGDSKLMGAV